MADEEELRDNSERTTTELMDIFNDPFFVRSDAPVELRQIEF